MPTETPPPKSPSAPNLRKRRFPYTSVACDECQRRKIKCTGERPCKGCRDVNADCLFERNTRFRSKGRVAAADASTSRAHRLDRSEPSLAPPKPGKPGSSDYYLGLAGRVLASSKPDHSASRRSDGVTRGIDVQSLRRLIHYRSIGASVDILSLLADSQWKDIIWTYEEEIGLQYPFLDLGELRREIQAVHQNTTCSAQRSVYQKSGANQQQQRVRDILLLLAAIVFIIEDSEAVDIAISSVEEIHAAALVKTQLGEVDHGDLSVMILTSIYFFLSDREVLAWRGNGIVLRLLQEMGYQNLGDVASKDHNQERDAKEKLFWTVYTLDRRWSYGTGLSFAIQDSDIDHDPSFTENSPSSAYLKHMVAYCRIASDVRTSTLEPHSSSSATSDAARDFLDFRVVEWRRNLPVGLRFRGIEDKFCPREENRGHYRLRLTLYLRCNQMRTIIHRKWAVRPGSTVCNPSNASVMATVAQDTIRILVALAHDTDIYHAQHRTFNHYLQTALSSLLLVACCTGDVDTKSCLRDAHAAIGLVRGLSAHSPITKKLLDKLQHVQGTLQELEARNAETLRPLQGSLPTQRKARAPDLERSRQNTGGTDIKSSSTTSRVDSGSPLIRCEGVVFSNPLSFNIEPSSVTGDTTTASYGYVPTSSSVLSGNTSAQLQDSSDVYSFLPPIRFPGLLGELLNEDENNFSF